MLVYGKLFMRIGVIKIIVRKFVNKCVLCY